MKKALVTGGCGFIGSNLTKELVKQGWQVERTPPQSYVQGYIFPRFCVPLSFGFGFVRFVSFLFAFFAVRFHSFRLPSFRFHSLRFATFPFLSCARCAWKIF